MPSTIRRTAPLGLLAVVGLLGCPGEKVTAQVDDFLPTFTNAWKNVANQNHTFQLNSTDDGKASGAFDGIETQPNQARTQSSIVGTFTHSVVQLTIQRVVGGNLVYAGKFLAEDTLRLTRTGETIIIARQ